jgi:hypothetical protein
MERPSRIESGHCDGNGLLLANVWRLGLRIPLLDAFVVSVVSSLNMVIGCGLVLSLGGILVHVVVTAFALVVVNLVGVS